MQAKPLVESNIFSILFYRCFIDFPKAHRYNQKTQTPNINTTGKTYDHNRKNISRHHRLPVRAPRRPRKTRLFDIETTGFSADYNTVYLIGCIWPEGDQLRFIQWFADTKTAEADVLNAFFEFLKNFRTLVHFNGDMFDIPFVTKRAGTLKLTPTFDCVESIDIFRRIKPFKKLLGLPDMKQKTIERFLKISREDLYNGGELIEVYLDYLKTRDEEEKRLLLLHNEDDLKGMPSLLPVLFYPDFFAQDFTLSSVREASGETDRLLLSLAGDPETILPAPVSASVPPYCLSGDKDRMELPSGL